MDQQDPEIEEKKSPIVVAFIMFVILILVQSIQHKCVCFAHLNFKVVNEMNTNRFLKS